MPQWSTDGGSDDSDPTAALSGLRETHDEAASHDATPAVPATQGSRTRGPRIPDMAGDPYVDATESVRLWVDDDRRLVKVKLSNRWRERSDTPLTQRFRQPLQAAQTRVSAPLPLPESGLPSRAPGAEVPLDAIVRRLFELRAARRALKARGDAKPSTWTGRAGRGHSADRNVTVGLDREERTVELTLDEEWVRTARADEITTAVLQAHQAAYHDHQPGEFMPGEFGRLAQEAAALAAELAPNPMMRRTP